MSRSFLFIPGDVPRMIQQLEIFSADSVILDFEDSVATHQKDEARNLVESFLTQHHFTTPAIYVRINATDSDEFIADMQTLKNLPIKGIVLPKASLAAIETVTKHLTLPIIALLETPSGFLSLPDIAQHPSVEGLLLGAEDLAKSLDLERTVSGEEILYFRSQLVLTAKAYHKYAIDTPFTNTTSDIGLLEDIKRSRQLGFDAKAAIHPNHISAINQHFSPSEAAIHEARRIMTIAEKQQSVRFSLDGRMIDKPIIDRAKKTLDLAKRYRLL